MQARASDLDIQLLDKKIDQMMPELGFTAEDNDRLVASYRRAAVLDPYDSKLLYGWLPS